MTRIYLARHGQTHWNLEKRIQGWQDSPLTSLGEKQARALRERLLPVKFDRVYSSPSGRAASTAMIVTHGRGLDIIPHEGLREINFGDWEGRNYHDVERDSADEWLAFWKSPVDYSHATAEDFTSAGSRVSNALAGIASANPDSTVLVVSHAVAIKLMMAFLPCTGRGVKDLWQGPFQTETALSLLEYHDGCYSIVFEADNSHTLSLDP